MRYITLKGLVQYATLRGYISWSAFLLLRLMGRTQVAAALADAGSRFANEEQNRKVYASGRDAAAP